MGMDPVCTIYDNNGYLNDPNGGTRLEIAKSSDNCRTWQSIFIIQEPGRDLDNGQIVQLENGDLLIMSVKDGKNRTKLMYIKAVI